MKVTIKILVTIIWLTLLTMLDLKAQSVLTLKIEGKMRESDNPNSRIICVIPKGTKVNIISYNKLNGYYKINFQKKEGYINDLYLISGIDSKGKENISISSKIKQYVENEINKWQQKGEFEKTSDYQERVNLQSRNRKIQELAEISLNTIKDEYRNSLTLDKITLGNYDADNETFLIQTKDFGQFALQVPINVAPSFKSNWKTMVLKNVDFYLKDDLLYIAHIDLFSKPLRKTFTYDSRIQTIYSLNNISYSFSPIEIILKENENNKSNVIEKKNIVIGKSDVDINIPIVNTSSSETFALIIGNENYRNEIVVPFATNDASVFAEYCEKTLGIPKSNLRLLLDGTYGQMLGEIKWISDVIKVYNGDVKVIIYYAGHGMPSENDKSSYLLPIDGNSTITQTAIKLDDLYSDLASFPTNSISVFLDACFSGAGREGSLMDGRGVKILPREGMLTGNLVVLSATSADETALPIKEYSHGLFTYFLLKKLQETKGDVTMKELSKYVIDNVKKQSVGTNNKIQNPRIIFSPSMQNTWEMIKLR